MKIVVDSIVFKTHEQYFQFPFTDILYCVSDGSYTDFHLEDGTNKKVCGNLRQIENELFEYGFMRIHNTELVNKKKISSFCSKHNTLRIADQNLPISRKHRKKVILELLKNKVPDIKNPTKK